MKRMLYAVMVFFLLCGCSSKKNTPVPEGPVTATINTTPRTTRALEETTTSSSSTRRGQTTTTTTTTTITTADESKVDSAGIYVAEYGSDENDGSINKPLRSLQEALDKVQAGQTIYLREGTYNGNYTFTNSGSSNAYITLTAYENESVTIKGLKSYEAIIDTNGQSYLRISNLKIGETTAKEIYGILLSDSEHHIEILNNEIYSINGGNTGDANAILLYGEDPGPIHDVLIKDNKVHDNTTGYSESISIAGNCENIQVMNNTVYNNTNIGIDFFGLGGYNLASLDQPRNCVASGNVVYGNKSPYATNAGIYVDGAKDITVSDNTVYNNMYGIEIGSENYNANYHVENITVKNNKVYDNPDGGIRIGGYTTDKVSGTTYNIKVSGNTLTNNHNDNGEIMIEKVDGVTISNNTINHANNEYPVIGGDMESKYVKNVTFTANVYNVKVDTDEIYFHYQNVDIYGIDNFNKVTGGNDSAKKAS